MNKKFWLAISIVIVLTGLFFLVFLGGRQVNNEKSTSVPSVSKNQRVESSDSVSSTRKISNYTVTDLKNNAKLAAVSFILYGANNINSAKWVNQRDCFRGSQKLIVKVRSENKADYILAGNGQSVSEVGYTLTGKYLNQIHFFTLNGSNKKSYVASVDVKKVLLFINTKFTNKELNEYTNNLTVSTDDTNGSAPKSNIIKQEDLKNQNVYYKVMIFYGLNNAYGIWTAFNNELANNKNAPFDVLSGTGGNGRATHIHFGQQEGEAQIGLPDPGNSSGKYVFSYDNGEDDSNGASDPTVAYATSEEILKYVNNNGGYQAINGINVKVRTDND
ncbi:hypothetical protein [Lactiplantibacillus plantarum]|uniref:hypothetical protein n=1 Tax=Lactiplantibacillus plantarum TaxID=1590 RepID=UPI001455F0E0|nr:hypothetical protein [Lactiplantibacillus plantarum]NLS63325.1 hypothetical protein [Lactiplantibacillus plantarum]